MSNAKITLFGCDAYFSNLGQSLFDNLTLPEGITKDTLVDNILLRGGDFECQYGDPEFIRRAIGAWSLKWQPTMKRWVDALAIEYAPLENYDRMEDWTDNTERSEAASTNEGINRTLGRTEDASNAVSEATSETTSGSKAENTGSVTTETTGGTKTETTGGTASENATYSQSDAKHTDSDTDLTTDRDKFNSPPKHTVSRSAYDSSNYEPLSQETDTGKWVEGTSSDSNESSATSSQSASNSSTSGTLSGSTTGTLSGQTTGTLSGATSGTSAGTRNTSAADNKQTDETEGTDRTQDTSSAMNNDFVHSGRIHGNIGVTTSQQMLLQELELGYWNIYEKITELFLQEFTIPVYI